MSNFPAEIFETRAEVRAELNHRLAELRAGRGEWPPWIESREVAIRETEMELMLVEWEIGGILVDA